VEKRGYARNRSITAACSTIPWRPSRTRAACRRTSSKAEWQTGLFLLTTKSIGSYRSRLILGAITPVRPLFTLAPSSGGFETIAR
jgi:hypothetical protein